MYQSEFERRRIERKARLQHDVATAKKSLGRLDKGLTQYTKHHPIVATLLAVTAGLVILRFLLAAR